MVMTHSRLCPLHWAAIDASDRRALVDAFIHCGRARGSKYRRLLAVAIARILPKC
jgi:hypothetical protein